MGRGVMLTALAVCLMACSPSTGTDAPRSGKESRGGPSQQRTEAVRSGPPATLDYVALGDSLAAGVGAERGYVGRYTDHISSDTGARVRTTNLGVSGQTSRELLDLLRGSQGARRALRHAEVVTVNIGLNDLGHAAQGYQNGTCGGADGERCLRAAVTSLGENWNAILAKLEALGVMRNAIVRTPGLGYVPQAGANLRPYVDEVNRHIAETDAGGVRSTEVRLGAGDMSQDGLHPNDSGYAAIAGRLRELGYGTLTGRRAAR